MPLLQDPLLCRMNRSTFDQSSTLPLCYGCPLLYSKERIGHDINWNTDLSPSPFPDLIISQTFVCVSHLCFLVRGNWAALLGMLPLCLLLDVISSANSKADNMVLHTAPTLLYFMVSKYQHRREHAGAQTISITYSDLMPYCPQMLFPYQSH